MEHLVLPQPYLTLSDLDDVTGPKCQKEMDGCSAGYVVFFMKVKQDSPFDHQLFPRKFSTKDFLKQMIVLQVTAGLVYFMNTLNPCF